MRKVEVVRLSQRIGKQMEWNAHVSIGWAFNPHYPKIHFFENCFSRCGRHFTQWAYTRLATKRDLHNLEKCKNCEKNLVKGIKRRLS